jgi:hypothetical protein
MCVTCKKLNHVLLKCTFLCILTTFHKKIKMIIELKNKNGTHHTVITCSEIQVQLSGLTEWLVSNIATRILIRAYRF